MKRGAERQISKQDEDDEEDEIEESGEGFKKADESVIASRKIRALPRRSMAHPTTPLTNGASSSETPPTSKPTSGFAGFGVTASNSTSFSFTPPAASAFSTAPAQSTPFSSSKSTGLFSSGSPAVAPSASNATKAFASIMSSTNTPEPTPPAPPPPSAAPVKPSSAAEDAALKYYISLRGLNVSFLSAVNEALEEDPFIDVTLIMERYRDLRIGMQKEFDEKTQPAPVAAPLSMPKPPGTGSFTFATPTPSASGSTKEGGGSGGFVPKIESSNATASSSPFVFKIPSPATSAFGNASESKPSSETKPQAPFGSIASASGAMTGSSAFGASSSSSPTSAFGPSSTKTTSAPSPFFGASKPDAGVGSTTASLFGVNSDKDKPSAPATFGTSSGNVFGSASSPFGAAPSGTFGAGSTSAFGSGSKPIVSAFGTAKPAAITFGVPSGTPSNPFAFSSGSSATPSTPTPAPFGSGIGKPTGSGSIGNPVGFVFGSPTKAGDASGADRSTPLAFPASGAESAPVVNGASASREGTSDEDAGSSQGGEGDDGSKMLGKNPHDEEGEGEEGEDTLHAIKLKAYKMTKKDENGNGGGWNELGHGVLRLKKHKTTESRRVLMRNSSTGKININFGINASLKPSLTKKSITFVGYEDGSPQPYCVRLQTEAQAKALNDALTREIDFVKAKTGE